MNRKQAAISPDLPFDKLRANGSRFCHNLLIAFGLLFASAAYGGAQVYQPLSASVRSVLHNSIADQAVPEVTYASRDEERLWTQDMPRRVERYLPDREYRTDFLRTVYYEANRAGLDPLLVLGLINVESRFRKYAVSEAGARGYMQVMPFWLKEIGSGEQNLFHLRTNLRYGCTILRFYLDMEKGDLYRALGRYNGSLGKPEYPNLVRAAWRKFGGINPRFADAGERGF
ncbi:MAG: transglycosylase SLT domain-containing protein [Nitrosomonadales bacterium]|nr:transglycosylase SLT domain-containing protein [Nitrosomonadales bacterium]